MDQLVTYLLIFVNKPSGNGLIRIDSPVTHKRPMRAVAVCFCRINFHHSRFFFFVGSFVNEASKGIGYKRAAPEFHRSILLEAYTIYTYHMHTVGNGMAALNRLPRIILFFIRRHILRSGPANSSWIK